MPTTIKYSGPFVSMDFFKKPAMESVTEIAKVVTIKAKESFLRQRSRKNTKYTGTLISSFVQIPVVQKGNTVFKSIVFAGGPTAPYTPIVDHIGWNWQDGKSKPPYFFMKEGAEKGQEKAGNITLKYLRQAMRGK